MLFYVYACQTSQENYFRILVFVPARVHCEWNALVTIDFARNLRPPSCFCCQNNSLKRIPLHATVSAACDVTDTYSTERVWFLLRMRTYIKLTLDT